MSHYTAVDMVLLLWHRVGGPRSLFTPTMLLTVLAVATSWWFSCHQSAIAQSTYACGKTPAILCHEKDLVNDTKDVGVGMFKWSLDSKRIAYVNWKFGTVSIVDVDSGKTTDIPGVQLEGVHNLAWSLDGKLLALASGTELKIVRIADAKIISKTDVIKIKHSWHPSFGPEMAFSRDGTRLLFLDYNGLWLPSVPEQDRIVLGAFDLATNLFEPLLRAPLGMQSGIGVLAGSSRFQWHEGRLYFSAAVARTDIIRLPETIIDRTIYGATLIPVNCYVFDLGEDGQHVESTRSVAFPPPGQGKTDGSNFIHSCRYSPTAERLVVEHTRLGPPPYYKQEERLYEAVRVGTGDEGVQFRPEPTGRVFLGNMVLELVPSRPWALVLGKPKEEKIDALILWDFINGREVSRLGLDGGSLYLPLVAPDGSRIAFGVRDGSRIAIYKLDLGAR